MAESQPEYGPMMKQLPNDRWRRFVECVMEQGHRDATKASRDAGFEGTAESMRTRGCNMMKDERILRAIHEEGTRRLKGTMLALAQNVHRELLDNPQTDPAVRLKGVQMVYDRAGLHATSEVKHTHEHIASDGDLLSKIARLAVQLHLDPAVLLGNRVKALEAPTIDADYTELSANDLQITSVEDLI